MAYDECKWWCQTGVGFPSLAEPGRNDYLQGMRWECPCGRHWRVRGDDWVQETRPIAWILNRWWRFIYPEWMENTRARLYRARRHFS